MKNKKSLWILVAFCLIMPAMLVLTACGHKHDYSQEWSRNAEYHWHACTDKKCEQVSSKDKHDYTDDNDVSCNTCGYERIAKENTLTTNIQPRTYNCAYQGLVQGTDFTTTYGTATITYKEKDSTKAFSRNLPKNAGEYTARIRVSGNAVYKAIDEQVNFKIEKFKILEKQKCYTMYYNGTTTGEDAALDPHENYEINKRYAPDRLRVKLTFPDAKAGTRSSSVELFTNCDDKSVLNNYEFDTSKAYSVIYQKSIYLGNGRKDDKLKVYNDLDGEFSLMSLDGFDIVEGDDVSLKINGTTQGLTFGDKIIIVAKQSEYVAGKNYLATLVGEKASNYSLWDYGTATYIERETSFVGQVRNDSIKTFGATGDVIKFGATHFVVNQNNNDYRSLIYTSGNEDKQVTINVYAGSNLIAQIKRVGIKSLSDMQFEYLGGNLNVDEGSADFNLLKNVKGYTDEQGRWICKDSSVTLEMVLAFDDVDEINEFDINFGSGKLTTNSIYVFKFTNTSSDYAIRLNYGSLNVNINVYNADGQDEQEEGLELEYNKVEGSSYNNPVYFYVEVLEGSSTATLSVECVEF